ncbi:NAD(P)H-binding protein [Pseudoclavibacter soli]|uniref:NAD(P)H-binding protein n=1 Tax=Pseudoclavibacter soli TaxID=452623 RepID=UPI00040E1A33|nr:NAD(P)H-binding protein [Pseudoclavibacter soli]
MSRILILGGHGRVALLATPKLVARGHEVTSVVRDDAQFGDVEAAGGHPRLFNLELATTDALVDLISPFDAVVWSAGAGGGDPTRTWAIDRDAAVRSVQAAVIAQVRRYVMVSWAGSRLNHGIPEGDSFYPYAQAKAIADAVVRDSGLDFTVLGPARLTDEPGTGAIGEAATRVSAGASAVAGQGAAVSRDDVAAAIVAVLEDRDTAGHTITFGQGDIPIAEYVGLAEG